MSFSKSDPKAPGLSFPLHDLASLVNTSQDDTQWHHPQLRQNLIFFTAGLYKANDEDNRMLREILGFKAVLNIGNAKVVKYHQGTTAGSHKAEAFAVENVLGITSCQLHFRQGAFIENLLAELPAGMRNKLNFKASLATDYKDVKLQAWLQSILPVRNSVDDAFAILQAFVNVVGYVFNSILSKPKAFPILISGSLPLRDNSIFIFLLLSVLEMPEHAIERALLGIGDDLSNNRIVYTGAVEQKQKTGHDVSSLGSWTTGLRRRVEAKYGSLGGYFRSAGITEATKDRMKESLLAAASEKKGNLIDFEP